jgi:hypothetical protein
VREKLSEGELVLDLFQLLHGFGELGVLGAGLAITSGAWALERGAIHC